MPRPEARVNEDAPIDSARAGDNRVDRDRPDDDARDAREDAWLAVRCQLGERDAFEALIRRWHAPIRQYAWRLTGSVEAADDIAQDTWLRVLRGIGRLRDGTQLRAWLFGIARRVVMDRLRERYAAPATMAFDPDRDHRSPAEPFDDRLADRAPAFADPAASLEWTIDLDTMRREIDRLPLLEREALTLFYLRELSLADVAQVLDVPIGTVKSRLFRARHLLRQQLDLEGTAR